MKKTPQCIPIPSDIVLKVCVNDLYDAENEAITLEDIDSIKLTFLAGGIEKEFDLIPEGECTEGASIVIPDDNSDPYIVVCLCTDGFLPGDLTLRSEINIPDTRFHDDIRKEIAEAELFIKLT